MPPSTSIGTSRAEQLAQARDAAGPSASMNGWPPQPGLTVMQSTWSSAPASPSTTSTGVAGLSARPAWQPASRMAFSA